MKITIQHFDGQYPSFNISLHSQEGAEPFLVIKGCKIMQGTNGPFVSYPSRKQDNGKYWNHVYGGDKFNEAVLNLAERQQPSQRAQPPRQAQRPSHDAARARQLPPGSGFDDMDDDIEFR